jgi:hypothetical protein
MRRTKSVFGNFALTIIMKYNDLAVFGAVKWLFWRSLQYV